MAGAQSLPAPALLLTPSEQPGSATRVTRARGPCVGRPVHVPVWKGKERGLRARRWQSGVLGGRRGPWGNERCAAPCQSCGRSGARGPCAPPHLRSACRAPSTHAAGAPQVEQREPPTQDRQAAWLPCGPRAGGALWSLSRRPRGDLGRERPPDSTGLGLGGEPAWSRWAAVRAVLPSGCTPPTVLPGVRSRVPGGLPRLPAAQSGCVPTSSLPVNLLVLGSW